MHLAPEKGQLMETREATLSDVDAIVRLIEDRRVQLEKWEPNFWRKSAGSAEMSRSFLSQQVDVSETSLLVAISQEKVNACLLFKPTFVPPVYNPGGTTWMVDDFVVRDGDWDIAGEALLEALKSLTIVPHGGQLIFPVPYQDADASVFLEKHELSPTTVWWTVSNHE